MRKSNVIINMKHTFKHKQFRSIFLHKLYKNPLNLKRETKNDV